MRRRTLNGRWYKIAFLAALLFASGIGWTLVISFPAQASETVPASAAVPDGGIRDFIALPKVDTVSIQNVFSTSAQVEINFIQPTGTLASTISDTLPAAYGRIYGRPPGFDGFARIGSDVQVRAVNFALDDSGSSAYLGIDAGSTAVQRRIGTNAGFTFDVPIPYLVKKYNGWTARFSIQNLGAASSLIAITYYDAAGGLAHVQTEFLSVGGALSVDLVDLADNALSPGFVGSAVISSDQEFQVASAVQLYNSDLKLRSAYPVEFADSLPPLIVPALFKNADSQTSQLCVQNTTENVRTVDVAYADGRAASQVITAYSTHCFHQGSEAHVDGWVGGAIITADTPGSLLAVVIVDSTDGGKATGRWSYTVAAGSRVAAQKALAFPLLFNDYQGWSTNIHLSNYGDQPATVSLTYVDQSGFTPCTMPLVLAAGETRTLAQADLPAQFVSGSAYFTSTLPIAAAVSAKNTQPGKDRHFGYGAAYLDQPGTKPEGCTEGVEPAFRPADEQYRSYQRDTYSEIGAPEMWQRGLTGVQASNLITVAVIDTGVDLDHPDLAGNLVQGYDFVEDDLEPQDTSTDSHGTMVAGIIAARMNNDLINGRAMGVVGIGGGNALFNQLGLRIMPLRVATESTSVSCELSTKAINYAVAHGANIINISYGSTDFCAEELAAIQRAYDAGLLIVAGAGNNSSGTPFYPAAYGAGDNANLVMAVAGLDPGGAKAYESNYGNWVDIGAPYYRIRSLTKDGGYATESGTSFGTPLVSGLFGLLMSHYNWSRNHAIDVLRATADNVDEANQAQYRGLLGAGRINAGQASKLPESIFLPHVVAKLE